MRVSSLRVLFVSGLIAAALLPTFSASQSRQGVAGQAAAGSGSAPGFTTIDVPGAGAGTLQGTAAIFMDAAEDIAGVYLDANGIEHGYFRSAAGAFTSFDVPGAGTGTSGNGTFPIGMDAAGDVLGLYEDSNKVMHGFVRSATTGTITGFSVPGAGTGNNQGTFPTCIDAAGDIAGSWVDSNNLTHGFVRSASGAITTFDAVPITTASSKDNQGTYVAGINSSLVTVGFYIDANSVVHGFTGSATGKIVTIDAPGAGTSANEGTAAYSIDAAGDVAGIYVDTSLVVHGFVYPAGGKLTSFDASGAGTGTLQGTYPAQFDAAGDLAGILIDANNVVHGFMRSGSGAIATYSAPGASMATGMLKSSGRRLAKSAGKAGSFYNPFAGHSKKPGSPFARILGTLTRMGQVRSQSSGSTPTGGIFNDTAGIVAGTLGLSVDAAGDVTGIYSDGDDVSHGFLRAANGSITTFEAPAAGAGAMQGTGALTINASASIAGTYADENSALHGFLLTLGQTATTTTLTPAPASSVYGEAVTLTAKVASSSGTPPDGETVWFMNGATTLGTETLSGGSAAFTTTGLPGGSDSITAVYGGDTNFAGSTSTAVTETIAKASSTVKLTASANSASYGQFVTFTAAVSGQYGGTATGTVTFKDGVTTLGTEPLVGGTAGFTTAAIPIGTGSVTAVYGGDANFSGGTSNSVSLAVTQATPSISWPNPAAIPNGTPLGAAELDAVASVPGTFVYSPGPGTVLAMGSQTLSVTFTPKDTVDYTTAKASATLVVTAAASTTPTVAVTPSSTSITTVQALTVKVGVYSGLPNVTATGTVVLTSGSYTSDTMPLAGGAAEFGIPAGSLVVGSDSLTVTYTPDAASWSILTGAKGSASVSVSQGIAPSGATTTLAVTSGGNPVTTVTVGSVVTLTATAKSGSTALTTGLVDFCDATAPFCTDIHLLGTAQLTSAGTASIKLRPGTGNHSYKAVFAGTKTYGSGASAASALTVTGMNPSASAITQTGTVGNYTLTATVGGPGMAPPTGAVSFLDSAYGDALLGSATLEPVAGGMNWLASQTPPTAGFGDFFVAVGDFNGDGIPDIAVLTEGSPGSVTILLGNGDGTFTEKSTVTAGFGSRFIAVGDFNGDGIPDLAVVNVCNGNDSCSIGTVSIFLGNGDGTFTQAAGSPVTVGIQPVAAAVGDFNGDGIPDLAVVNSQNGNVTILLGNGKGGFAPAANSSVTVGNYPTSVAVADFNGDGIQDLAVANQGSSSISILLGKGDGTFRSQIPISVDYSPSSITAADFNGDGIPDIAVIIEEYPTSVVEILLGNGDGTFKTAATPSTGDGSSSVKVADFNSDGIPDLAVVNESGGNVTILLGNGDGTFTQAANSPVGVGNYPFSVAVGDFNGDGVPDLAVAMPGSETATILLTEAQTASASITGVSVAGLGPHLAVTSYPGDSDYSPSVSAPASLYAPSPTPVFSPAAGSYTTVQEVTLSDAAAGAVFYYTTNGTAPTTNSEKYMGPITVSTAETFQAIAVATGYAPSAVASAVYNVNLPAAATPVISPAAGAYPSAQTVTITDATPGVAIYYTTNGTQPTLESPVYSGPIAVAASETVVAMAAGGEFSAGPVASAQYIISSVSTSMIYTLAGDGMEGYSGDGGAATLADVNEPFKAIVDGAGNLYFSDPDNNRIRMVSKSTGIITTIAGTGLAGYSGDGAAATGAQLNYPMGLAFDKAGNLYIADNGNQVIRKVTLASGVISTVAGNGSWLICAPAYGWTCGDGGPATSAELGSPAGIAFDKAGNLYISEQGGVREVYASNGTINTIAGNGQWGYSGDNGPAIDAELSEPFGVAVDGAGNVYVADTYNSVVREVLAGSGTIRTVAGNYYANGGFKGDGGPATSATLSDPYDVALDPAGNLYISDTFNGAIRRVAAGTQIITTVAGNGVPWYCTSGDGGPATSADICEEGISLDSAGNIYMGGFDNRVRVVTAASLPPATTAAAPVFSLSAGTYATPQTLTLSDATPGASIYYTLDGTTPTPASLGYAYPITISGTVTVRAIAVAPGYLQSPTVSAAYTITAPPAEIMTTVAGNGVAGFSGSGGPATSAEIGYPYALTTDSAGNIYFTDTDHNVVWMVSAKTGIATVVAGNGTRGYSGDGRPATQAQLSNPEGIVVDSAGNIYIADTDNYVVRKVFAATGIITTYAGNGQQGYSGDGGPATSAQLSYFYGLALDSAGNLLVADEGNCLIRKITAATGIITTLYGTLYNCVDSGDGGLATNATFGDLFSLGFDSSGDLFIGEQARIRKVTASTGIVNTVAGNGDYGYDGDGGPATSAEIAEEGMAFDSAGNLYLSNWPGAVREVPVSTGIITTFAGNGQYGYLGDGKSATIAGIGGPIGIAFDGAGNLYVADSGGARIRKVAPPPPLATPAITWPQPAAIAYGTALSTTQLDATTSVAGTFVYNPQAGTVLAPGSQLLSTTFTPADPTKYTTATSSVTLQVNQATPTDVLTTSASKVTVGSPVTLTATLTGAGVAPTGTVTFLNGTSSLGTGPLTNGVATLTLATLPVGSYSVTASYPGDSNYLSATSTAVSVAVINLPTPTIKLAASAASIAYGSSVGLTATLSGSSATPTGTVTFLDGTAQLGTGTLNGSGVATYSATGLTGGTHSITASYPGNSNYSSVTSSAVTVTVTKASQTITFTPVPASVTYGASPIALAATASSGLAVTFSATGPATVSGNTLTFTGTGSVVVTANQGGNGNYSAAPAVTQTIKVAKATPTAVLTSSETSGPYGAPVTLTATLAGSGTGAPPTGTVTFLNGSTSVGTGTLNSSGVATLTLTTLPIGTDSLKASYVGDSNYATATSPATSVTVNKGTQTITFPQLASPVAYGVSPIKLSATASSGLTVSFSATGPATVSGSTLTITGVGSVTVTASQAGNSSYSAAAPVQQTVTVTTGTASIALKSSATGSVAYGTQVTLTATLTGGGAKPTGTVTFLNGTATLGTGTLNSSGAATLAVSTLPVGANSITASYAGDSHYAASTSTAVSQTITQATPTVKLTSSSSTPSYGASVTLTATLTGAAAGAKPTGTVTFLNGTATLGTGAVNSGGVVTLAVTSLPVGKDSITASYGGDGNYAAAVSSATTVTVGKASQTITFTPVAASVTYGVAPMTLAATASSGLAVTFSATGPATVNGTTLTITGAGTVVVTANQAGNGNYSAAPAASQTIKVAKATPTAALKASATAIAPNTPVTFTATFTGAATAPTGTVTFLDGKTTLGTGTLSGGVATYSTTKLAAGTHSITASYGGDTNYGPATSGAVTVTVSAH
jgi:sugar lactone lactonase YvrE